MDPTDTYFALKELGIELRLNPGRTRLGVGKHQAHLVSDELRAAVKEHHDELIRGELFRRAVAEPCSSMREDGSGPGGPAYEAGRDAFGGDGRDERLNAAWHDEDLDGFKVVLEGCSEAAQAAYRAERAAADGHGVPPVEPTGGHDGDGLQLPLVT